MGDDALDRDARIKLSIGTKQQGNTDGLFRTPVGLVFDHHRGLLLVVDSGNHQVQVFSCDDDDDGCSFVSKLGEKGNQPGQLKNPFGLAIDHDHDRILMTDYANHGVQSWSLSEQSFLQCIGHEGSADIKVRNTRGIAIDKHHHRIVIADSYNHRLVFLSSIDLSFLFSVGGKRGSQPGEFYSPSGIAIDHDRHRIIVCDNFTHRIWSCIRRASRSHRLLGRPSSACDWSQSMACRHVHMASRSSSTCSIMDQAHGVDDDDDSIAGR